MLMPVDDENAFSKLAKAAARRAVLAFAGAVGAKVGEQLVEWAFGTPDDEDEEEKP